jgi:hypothetical protein
MIEGYFSATANHLIHGLRAINNRIYNDKNCILHENLVDFFSDAINIVSYTLIKGNSHSIHLVE